ncbi:hypothetical protein STAQ_28420 [Allostella sp. ATCC 35155]|nr:hypothetical protein STAQ_28420 [Stella sp. ATCC 35155]
MREPRPGRPDIYRIGHWTWIAGYVGAGSAAAIVAIDVLLHATDDPPAGSIIHLRLAVAVAALAAGIALFALRRWRESYYGATEIIVGMAAASLFVQGNPDDLVPIIALAGGIRIIVDGLRRLLGAERPAVTSRS